MSPLYERPLDQYFQYCKRSQRYLIYRALLQVRTLSNQELILQVALQKLDCAAILRQQFGHRGINQPVRDKKTGKVEITAHNHGFAIKAPTEGIFNTVFGPGEVTHVGLNDGVVEGLQLLDRGTSIDDR